MPVAIVRNGMMRTTWAVLMAAGFAAGSGGCFTKTYSESLAMAVGGDDAGGAWIVAYDARAGSDGAAHRRRVVRVAGDGRALSTSTPSSEAMPDEIVASGDAAIGRDRFSDAVMVVGGAPRVLPVVDEATGKEIGATPSVEGRRFGAAVLGDDVVVFERAGERLLSRERTSASDLRTFSVDDDGTLRVVRVGHGPPGGLRTRDSKPTPAPSFITVETIGLDGTTRWTVPLQGAPSGVSISRDGHVALGIGRSVTVVNQDGDVRTSEELVDLPADASFRGVVALEGGATAAWAGSTILRIEPSGAIRRVDAGFRIAAGAGEGGDIIVAGDTEDELTAARFDAALAQRWRLSGCDCARIEP